MVYCWGVVWVCVEEDCGVFEDLMDGWMLEVLGGEGL